MQRGSARVVAGELVIGGWVVMAVLSGCGSNSDAGGSTEVLTVAAALDLAASTDTGATAAGTTEVGGELVVTVRGYVLAAPSGVVRLCAGLAGSFPPQCGAPAIELQGLDTGQLPERDPGTGVAWSGEMTVTGVLTEDVLLVRS